MKIAWRSDPTGYANNLFISREKRRRMKALQYQTFWCQAILSMAIYGPTLIVIAILVNFYPCFRYNSNIILENTEFNIAICTSVITGFLSLMFSRNPRLLSDVLSCHTTSIIPAHLLKPEDIMKDKKFHSEIEDKDSHDVKLPQVVDSKHRKVRHNMMSNHSNRLKQRRQLPKKALARMIVSIVNIGLVISPIVIAGLWINTHENAEAFIYFTHLNETKIIQVVDITVFLI